MLSHIMDEERRIREDEVQEALTQEPTASLGELIDSAAVGQQSVDEVISEPPPPPTFWQQVRQRLFPNAAELGVQFSQRIEDLSWAIEQHPDGIANYVLRGEVYLDSRAYELAADDFSRALELALAQFEMDDWGLVAQALQDRAQAGLKQAQRQLKKHKKDALL